MTPTQSEKVISWTLANEAAAILNIPAVVGVSGWDDDSGQQLWEYLSGLLDAATRKYAQASGKAKNLARAAYETAKKAAEKIKQSAESAFNWGKQALPSLSDVAKSAGELAAAAAAAIARAGGEALGAMIPWWVIPLAFFYFAQGSRSGSRR